MNSTDKPPSAPTVEETVKRALADQRAELEAAHHKCADAQTATFQKGVLGTASVDLSIVPEEKGTSA